MNVIQMVPGYRNAFFKSLKLIEVENHKKTLCVAFDLHYQHNKPTIIKWISLSEILKVEREQARLAQLVAWRLADPEIKVQTHPGQIITNKFSELTGLV